MVMLAFFFTTFVRKASVAVLIGIFFFIVGLLFESFIFSSSFLGYIWWKESLVDPLGYKLLYLLPFFNFGHMFMDITTFTTGKLDDLTDTFIPGPGFPWSQLYNTLPTNLLPLYSGETPSPPTPITAWYMMIMNVALYGTLLWYFDAIIPNEYGTRQPIYFFLLPSYWGYSSRSFENQEEWIRKIMQQKKWMAEPGEDQDVINERAAAMDKGIQLIGLKMCILLTR
jgi:hypothetical protein